MSGMKMCLWLNGASNDPSTPTHSHLGFPRQWGLLVGSLLASCTSYMIEATSRLGLTFSKLRPLKSKNNHRMSEREANAQGFRA